MRVKVIFETVQDCLSTEEAGEFLEQQLHVVTTTQKLYHITRKCIRVDVEYLGVEGPPSRAMAIWP